MCRKILLKKKQSSKDILLEDILLEDIFVEDNVL